MDHKHEWQGDCRGVHCLICGVQLTPAEYAERCKKPEEEPKKPKKKGGEKSE